MMSAVRETLVLIGRDLPGDVPTLAEALEKDLGAIHSNTDWTPDAKARKVADRKEQARTALAAIEERDLSQTLQPILREEGEMRASLLSQVPRIGQDKSEYEKQALLLTDVARRLERQERRSEAQAVLALLADASADEAEGYAEDAALLDDPAVTPVILRAAARRVDDLYKATPEHQRQPVLARQIRVSGLLADYKKAHPSISARMRAITGRRDSVSMQKRRDYANVRQLLKL